MADDLKNMSPEKQNDYIFEKYKSGDRGMWAQTSVNAIAFVNGLQWEEARAKALEAANQPALVDNEVTPAIDLLIANLTENDPRFQASGRETSDAETATNVSDLVSYIWDTSDGNEKVERSIRDFEYTGLGAFMPYYNENGDNGKGEIEFMALDPLEVYIDPNSKREDTEDAAHKMLVMKKTKEQIKNWLPKFSFEGAVPMHDEDIPAHDRRASQDEILQVADDDFHTKYRVIDRYTKFKDKRYKVKDTITGFEKIFTKDEYIEFGSKPAVVLTKVGQEMYVTLPSEVKKWLDLRNQYGQVIHFMTDQSPMKGFEHNYVDEFGRASIPGSTTKIEELTMTDLLNLGIIKYDVVLVDRIKRTLTVGQKLVSIETMPISHYPIVTFMLHHNRTPFPQGDVGLVKPLQEQLNKIDSLIIAYNTNITNIKVFVPKGSQNLDELNAGIGKAGTYVGEYDPELGVPVFVQHTQMGTSLYEQRNILIQQIQRILGSYSFQDGDSQNAPQTYGGTLTIEENMQKRTRFKRKKLERAINRLCKVIMEMVPYAYTEEKSVRILKANGEEKRLTFNEQVDEDGTVRIFNDISTQSYDVVMVSGSMMPTNRMARFQVFEALYEKGILQDKKLMLEQLDLPDLKEILEREDMITQAQQIIQQMSEEIEKLKGDNQTLSRETVNANQKIEVEKFKTKMNKLASKGEAGTLLAIQRMNDEVKNKKKKEVTK